MNYKNILVYKDGGIGVIKFTQAKEIKMLHPNVLLELDQALSNWESHEGVKVIVFTGEEESFSSDIAHEKCNKAKTSVLEFPSLSELCEKVERSSKVTIAAINEDAIGDRCELAICCDIRIACEQVKIGSLNLNIGGGAQRLARMIGKDRAIKMILTGELITVQTAEKIGLVTNIVLYEDLWTTVLEIAEKIMTKGFLEIRLAKLAVSQGIETNGRTAFMLERLMDSELLVSEEKHDGFHNSLKIEHPLKK